MRMKPGRPAGARALRTPIVATLVGVLALEHVAFALGGRAENHLAEALERRPRVLQRQHHVHEGAEHAFEQLVLDDPLHKRIASLSSGEKVIVDGRYVKAPEGHTVGRLANKTDLKISASATGSVSGILVRTLEQTPAEYRTGVKADRWETVLVDLVLPGG